MWLVRGSGSVVVRAGQAFALAAALALATLGAAPARADASDITFSDVSLSPTQADAGYPATVDGGFSVTVGDDGTTCVGGCLAQAVFEPGADQQVIQALSPVLQPGDGPVSLDFSGRVTIPAAAGAYDVVIEVYDQVDGGLGDLVVSNTIGQVQAVATTPVLVAAAGGSTVQGATIKLEGNAYYQGLVKQHPWCPAKVVLQYQIDGGSWSTLAVPNTGYHCNEFLFRFIAEASGSYRVLADGIYSEAHHLTVYVPTNSWEITTETRPMTVIATQKVTVRAVVKQKYTNGLFRTPPKPPLVSFQILTAGKWRTIAHVQAQADGGINASVRPTKTQHYRFALGTAHSRTWTVTVHPLKPVDLSVNWPEKIRRSGTFHLSVGVLTNLNGFWSKKVHVTFEFASTRTGKKHLLDSGTCQGSHLAHLVARSQGPGYYTIVVSSLGLRSTVRYVPV